MNNIKFLDLFKKLIKDNYKIIILVLSAFFVIFIFYQYYLYNEIKNINQNSIAYFNAKELKSDDDFYVIMKDLSGNKDFYSIISNLEMININLKNNNLKLAEEQYINLIENNKLNSSYISAIAVHGSYNYIDIIYETSNFNYIKLVQKFINYIDDNLDSYKGIKMELNYLLNITIQDINNISLKDDLKTLELYKSIMESEIISSSIKERVNKIHEFQLYK